MAVNCPARASIFLTTGAVPSTSTVDGKLVVEIKHVLLAARLSLDRERIVETHYHTRYRLRYQNQTLSPSNPRDGRRARGAKTERKEQRSMKRAATR